MCCYWPSQCTNKRLRCIMNNQINEMVKECKREEENCLYTSTTLYYYLKSLRFQKNCFIIIPIFLGGFSGIKILTESNFQFYKYIIAVCSLLAGILPTIYSSLKLDAKIEFIDNIAGQYKVLQSKFRRLHNIYSKSDSFDLDFSNTIKELENIKLKSITPPDKFFKKAQKKIKIGDYDFKADITNNV